MNRLIHPDTCFARFEDLSCPKIVAMVNGLRIKLARGDGNRIPWRTNDEKDELLYVLAGKPEILTREQTLIVPHDTEDRPLPTGYLRPLLVESVGIRHTGNVPSDIAVAPYGWLP